MRFTIVLLLITASCGLSAQQILFDKTIPEQNVPQASRLKSEIRSHYLDSRYVSQADFFTPQDFFIAITPNLIVKSKFVKMYTYPSGSSSYEGKLEGPATGKITFSKFNDRMAGLILLDDGRKYMIDQVSSDIFSISLSNEFGFVPQENHNDFVEVSGQTHPSANVSNVCDLNVCSGPSTIDIMVVYTQQAENSWGGAASTIANITQAVTNMNTSMPSSGINNVTFRLVHTAKVTYTESGNFSTDLSRLSATSDGYMDNVHALRDQYGADIVSLIIGSPTSSCGIGYLNTNASAYSSANAFNVTLYSCVIGNFTLAHESGHNMGLRHDWYVDASTSPCSHHHGYVNQTALNLGASSPTSSRWRTIMAYNDRCSVAGFNCTRVNLWSNPNLTYNGDATGSPIGTGEASDEAYAFNRMACLVASFRSTTDGGGGGGTQSCDAPSGLSTLNLTSTSATASWNAVTGASSYEVDYRATSWSYWINIASGLTSTSWGLAAMTPGISYEWRVRTNCSFGTSSYTQTQFTTQSSTSCNAPSGLTTINITTTGATATWSPVSGANSYNVDYKASSSGQWINIVSGLTSTSWGLAGISPATSYDWRVRANCSSGASSYTQTQFTTQSITSCDAPSGLAMINITTTSSTATWSPVSGANSYNVDYKASSSGQWINIASGLTSTSWGLAAMSPSTSYDWRVRANCSSGNSSYTQAQFSTLSQSQSGCNAPGGLSAYNIATNTATVSWNAVSGVIGYTVEYKPTFSSTWIVGSSITYATSLNLYALSAATTYDWRVKSMCTVVDGSSYSTAQFVTSGSTPPPASPTCPGPYDISSNGSTGGAASIPLNTDIKGAVSPKNDIDHYKFTISTGGTITVSLTTLPANYNLAVLNSSGGQIGISENNGPQSETITLNVAAGTYYAKVFPKGNVSSATSCYTVRVQTGTANDLIVKNNFAINLFPNPAHNQLNVWIDGIDKKADIMLFDVMGKLITQQVATNTLTQIDIAKLSAGFYMVRVNDGKETRFAKFVKQ